LILTVPCIGGELVVLTSGFSLEADSHSQDGNKLIFQLAAGTLELPADQVATIESLPPRTTPDLKAHDTPPKTDTQQLLSNAAYDQGLETELVRSVATIESGLRQSAVSSRGAVGLMQLMPKTAAHLGVDPSRDAENAEGGAKYLRELSLRYHGDYALMLAAYNAGPGAVSRFGGVPPYTETRQYVVKVLREYAVQKKSNAAASERATASKPTATN
jgi:soluble lytic murein transglycosylase-like protein